ncbi:unnamed protein product, partial [marine sediment metagenome]
LPYWRLRYRVTGLDISPAMLAVARRKFPDIEFHQGNMTGFNLDREFDALVCLYGSIGFVRTVENLGKALVAFAAHLKAGGVLCLTPWSTQEDFKPDIVVDSVSNAGVRIARLENVKLKEPGLVEIDFHHLVGRNGAVTYHQQTMEVGLFSRQQYTDAIGAAGLELTEYYRGKDMPMGIFVARKPLPTN